jgi:hypothetical protein
MCRWFRVVPWSLTSMMASLFGELVERRSSERTSRVMRGRVAIVIEDMARLCSRILQVVLSLRAALRTECLIPVQITKSGLSIDVVGS